MSKRGTDNHVMGTSVRFTLKLLIVSLLVFVFLSCQAQAEEDICDGLAIIKNTKDATVNRTSTLEAPGNLMSTGGSFQETGVDVPCDPPHEFGPFEVEAGGRLNASIIGNPPVPAKWSLCNHNTGMAICFAPRYGRGYGTEDVILRLGGQADDNDLKGSAEWSSPGRIKVVISAPVGFGPLTKGCFGQGYSANVDVVSFNSEGPARAGTLLKPDDLLETSGSGEATLLLSSSGGKLWVGPNSEVTLNNNEVDLAEDTLSLDSPVGKVAAKLNDLYDQGLPMPKQYWEDPSGFTNNFREGTLFEAQGIIENEADPCEAAVELKLFFDSHEGEWTGEKTVETAWTLFGKDEWDLLKLAYEGIPVYGQIAATIALVDDWNDQWEVLSRELKAWTASNQAKVGLDAFRKSKGWTEDDLDTNLSMLSRERSKLASEINKEKEDLARDIKNKEDETVIALANMYGLSDKPNVPEAVKLNCQDDVAWMKFDSYVWERKAQAFGNVSDLETKMAELVIQEKTLELYRAPIVRGTSDRDLKRPKEPVIGPCSRSGASITLGEGIIRYSNIRHSDPSGLNIKMGSYTVTPEGTELICEKRGDAGRIVVIDGSVVVSNSTASDVKLQSGQQFDLQTGAVSPYNLSTDDGGLVGGIPLRDLPLNDYTGQPYGFYFPEFNGTLSPGWIWQDPGEDASFNVSEPGTLIVTVPDGNDLWGHPGSTAGQRSDAPRLLHKVTGDFDLEGEILLQSNATHVAATEFVVYSPASYLGLLAGQMKLDGLGEHYRILGGGWVKMDGLNKLSSLNTKFMDGPDAPDGPVKVRLTRRGDLWKTYWSLDGIRWNLSTREMIGAPDTLWVGWIFKRMAYDAMVNEPAVTTLRDLSLDTAARGSLEISKWDVVQWAGRADVGNGSSARLELDGSRLGGVNVYSGRSYEGDFDAVVRFRAENGTYQPGERFMLFFGAASNDEKNVGYVGLTQADGHLYLADRYPRRYGTDLGLAGSWGRWRWMATADSEGYLRVSRQNGNISTYVWSECQWQRLDSFESGFSDPAFLFIRLSNDNWSPTANASVSVDFALEQFLTGDMTGDIWTPPDCNLVQPMDLPPELTLPEGVEALMLRPAFALGTLFFDQVGTAYIFSNQREERFEHWTKRWNAIVSIDRSGLAGIYAKADILAGVNRKSGAGLDDGVLVALDYWSEGGNAFSGFYELRPDGSSRKWNLTGSYPGLGDVIPAPDGGWFFADFEADNIWHLRAEGQAEVPLITQGGAPLGLVDLAFDEEEETLYGLSWGGSWPFGSALEIYRITDDGQAALVAKVNEAVSSGGIAISQKGPFSRGLYVSDYVGGRVLRVYPDGNLIPVITGLVKPGDLGFNPLTGDLLVICDDGRAILWVGESLPKWKRDVLLSSEVDPYADLIADSETEQPTSGASTTFAQLEAFQIEEWGRFRTAEYLGEKYFAAYEGGLLYNASKETNLIEDKQLFRVLFNSNEEMTVTTGKPLELQEDYELAIQAIDFDGNKAYVELRKDGMGVDSAIISPVPTTYTKETKRSTEDETYAYSVKMGDKTVEIISVHFKNAFCGPMRDMATVDRILQVSEDSPSRVICDSNEEMIVATGTPLKLEDDYELAIQAIDLDGNKVYAQLMKSGKVVDSQVVKTTSTPEGGENYAYSVKEGDEDDTISIRVKNVFRGAEQDRVVVDRVLQTSGDQPSRVIYENFDETIVTSDNPLKLEEGYELVVAEVDLNGGKAYVELYKDGVLVDSVVITPPRALGSETYTYSVDTTGAEDAEIIRVHFKNAFRGPMLDVATADTIWQASEYQPYPVIHESSEETVITTLEPLVLKEGYELNVAAIDLDGEKVYVELFKDGAMVDSAVITPPDAAPGDGAYSYSVDADATEGVELISVHFKNAFRSAEQDLATVDLIWQISEDQSSRVIYESSDETIVNSGAPLKLRDGYELVIEEIGLDGDKLYVELYKDGKRLDSAVVVPPRATIEDKTYTYVGDVGRTEDTVVIAVHFKNAFRGAEQDIVTVDGIWQISEIPIEIEETKATGEPVLIFERNSLGAVENDPPNPTKFTLDRPYLITEIRTYHWNYGKGQTPGAIGIQDKEKNVLKVMFATGLEGMGGVHNTYWSVQPNLELPPGEYNIIDSDPSTWSHNLETGGQGIAWVYGLEVKEKKASGTENATF